MTPEERVRADALLATGLERKDVRRMLATKRPLFAKLRMRRLQQRDYERALAAGLLDDDDDFPEDDDDMESRCSECGAYTWGETLCDECLF